MSLELLFSKGGLAKIVMGEPTDVAARHISNRPSGGEPFVTIEIIDDDAIMLTTYLTESLAVRLCGLLSAFKLERPVDFPMGVDPVAAIERRSQCPQNLQ